MHLSPPGMTGNRQRHGNYIIQGGEPTFSSFNDVLASSHCALHGDIVHFWVFSSGTDADGKQDTLDVHEATVLDNPLDIGCEIAVAPSHGPELTEHVEKLSVS